MREAYRLQKNELYALLKTKKLKLYLFIIYTGKEIPDYDVIYKKMNALIQSFIRIINTGDEKGFANK